ncbi:hypothetical protein HK099_002458 [Clydaea vesicula]|uniref:Uncharacterized protein n=1 Tax=Clydaea vesicula TaxID=447962 RepID=A0AAD5U2X5_9FUNG|nr:hypothetical protein HK099_002458 [Clydaea vesicula]
MQSILSSFELESNFDDGASNFSLHDELAKSERIFNGSVILERKKKISTLIPPVNLPLKISKPNNKNDDKIVKKFLQVRNPAQDLEFFDENLDEVIESINKSSVNSISKVSFNFNDKEDDKLFENDDEVEVVNDCIKIPNFLKDCEKRRKSFLKIHSELKSLSDSLELRKLELDNQEQALKEKHSKLFLFEEELVKKLKNLEELAKNQSRETHREFKEELELKDQKWKEFLELELKKKDFHWSKLLTEKLLEIDEENDLNLKIKQETIVKHWKKNLDDTINKFSSDLKSTMKENKRVHATLKDLLSMNKEKKEQIQLLLKDAEEKDKKIVELQRHLKQHKDRIERLKSTPEKMIKEIDVKSFKSSLLKNEVTPALIMPSVNLTKDEIEYFEQSVEIKNHEIEDNLAVTNLTPDFKITLNKFLNVFNQNLIASKFNLLQFKKDDNFVNFLSSLCKILKSLLSFKEEEVYKEEVIQNFRLSKSTLIFFNFLIMSSFNTSQIVREEMNTCEKREYSDLKIVLLPYIQKIHNILISQENIKPDGIKKLLTEVLIHCALAFLSAVEVKYLEKQEEGTITRKNEISSLLKIIFAFVDCKEGKLILLKYNGIEILVNILMKSSLSSVAASNLLLTLFDDEDIIRDQLVKFKTKFLVNLVKNYIYPTKKNDLTLQTARFFEILKNNTSKKQNRVNEKDLLNFLSSFENLFIILEKLKKINANYEILDKAFLEHLVTFESILNMNLSNKTEILKKKAAKEADGVTIELISFNNVMLSGEEMNEIFEKLEFISLNLKSILK